MIRRKHLTDLEGAADLAAHVARRAIEPPNLDRESNAAIVSLLRGVEALLGEVQVLALAQLAEPERVAAEAERRAALAEERAAGAERLAAERERTIAALETALRAIEVRTLPRTGQGN